MEINIDVSRIEEVMNPAFQFLLDESHRYVILRGGSGSSKSYSIIQALIYFILRDFDIPSSHRFLLLRKTGPSIKQSLLPDLKTILASWGISEPEHYKFNKTDSIFTFINGSEIILSSLDDPEKIKSLSGVDKIFMEELTGFTIADYRQLQIRMRGITDNIYQLFGAFNPVSRFSWVYDEFYMKKCPDNTLLHHSTYKDNEFCDDEYKQVLESYKDFDEQQYLVYALGNWGVLEGIIYEYKLIKEWSKEVDENVYGIDFGYIVPSSIVQVYKQKDDIYLEEKLYQTKMTNSDLIAWIKANLNPADKYYCDSAEPDRIVEMRRAGINAVKAYKGPKSVKDGIDYIKRHNIYITKQSSNLIKEFDGYKWEDKKKDGKQKEEPVKINDHACDAGRYAIFTHYGHPRSFEVYV